MLWAYFAFSQFLIIWSGNLPEEMPWYLKRITRRLAVLAIGLSLFHFFLPFLVLLSRNLKRNPRRLIIVALLMLFMRFVDLYWLIAPAFSPGQVRRSTGWISPPSSASAACGWPRSSWPAAGRARCCRCTIRRCRWRPAA